MMILERDGTLVHDRSAYTFEARSKRIFRKVATALLESGPSDEPPSAASGLIEHTHPLYVRDFAHSGLLVAPQPQGF